MKLNYHRSDIVMSITYTFRQSTRRDKKYDALLSDGRIVPFGGIQRNGEPYAQFKDRTPLKLYSAYDHNDPKRRERYYKRHKVDYPPYSADWLAKRFLWS